MLKANAVFREFLRAKQIPLWELAEQIGVCEQTIIRYMRTALDDEKRAAVYAAANAIMEQRRGSL